MNPHYISDALRQMVKARAGHRCEYCRMPDFLSFAIFHIDHIIPLKHGGKTFFFNLAYACPICNCFKGSDIATILEESPEVFLPFFNPRKHNWFEHFELDNGLILPKTAIAAGTARILRFNEINQVLERREMMVRGLYP